MTKHTSLKDKEWLKSFKDSPQNAMDQVSVSPFITSLLDREIDNIEDSILKDILKYSREKFDSSMFTKIWFRILKRLSEEELMDIGFPVFPEIEPDDTIYFKWVNKDLERKGIQYRVGIISQIKEHEIFSKIGACVPGRLYACRIECLHEHFEHTDQYLLGVKIPQNAHAVDLIEKIGSDQLKTVFAVHDLCDPLLRTVFRQTTKVPIIRALGKRAYQQLWKCGQKGSFCQMCEHDEEELIKYLNKETDDV